MSEQPPSDDAALESEGLEKLTQQLGALRDRFVEQERQDALNASIRSSSLIFELTDTPAQVVRDESSRRHLAPFVEEARQKALQSAALGTPPLRASVDYPTPASPRLIFNRPLSVREAADYLWGQHLKPEFFKDLNPVRESAAPDGGYTTFDFRMHHTGIDVLRLDVHQALWGVDRPRATPLSTQLRDPRIPPQVWSQMEWMDKRGEFASDKLPKSVTSWGAGRRGEDFLVHARQGPEGVIELTPFAFQPERLEYYNGVFPNDASLARRATGAAIEINQYTRYEMSKDPYLPPDEAEHQGVLKLNKLYHDVLGAEADFFLSAALPELAEAMMKYLKWIERKIDEDEEERRKEREESEKKKIYIVPTR